MIGDFFHRTYRFLRGRAAGGPRALAPTGRREDSSRPADPCFVCENLEPRLLLSVYTVTNVNDAGAGSFRQALVDANANAGLDTITFDIAGSGIHTIVPTSVLPDITDPVIIDATSQPDYAGTPLIELNGISAGNNRAGLTLESGSGGSTIRGLAINRFGGDGIHVTQSSGNLIEYNFIGTDPGGHLALGNGGDGIQLYFNAANNVIRYNVISANARGISIGIGSTDNDNNIIQANKIGTDVTGTVALGNTTAGITVGFGSINTLIGGPEAGQGNVIAFNGIGIEFRQNSATGHAILGNSIFLNVSLGIDLGSDGVTANDPGDGDAGPNNRQNFPVLTSAQVLSGTEVVIIGSFNSTADSYFRIEFFASAAADGSGYGQGQRYLGFVNVATDGSGNAVINATLTAAVAAGEFITATATRSDSTFSTFADSSEFAQNVVAVDAVVHTPSVTDATTDEDTQTTSGLVISRNSADGAEVTHFKITGITNGTLYQNDGTTPIPEGSFITFAQGNAGLKFTPVADFSGAGFFTVQASTSDGDAGLGGSTVVATITVNAVNDAPVLDLDADDSSGQAGADFATTFTEGGPAVVIVDLDAALWDVDSTLLNSLTVTITNLMHGAAESLAADTAGTSITASYDSDTGVLTLSGLDSLAHYQQVLRTVRYHDASEDPDTTARSITFVANDGARDSDVGTATVTILLVNNAPMVNDQSFSVDENAAPGTPVGTVLASDPDAGDRLTYSITAGNTGGAFALDADTGELTVANPAALDYETHPTFSVTVRVMDLAGRATEGTVTVNLNGVNEAPAVLGPRYVFPPPAAPMVFRSADGTGVAIRDVDAGAGNMRMEVRATNGEVTLAGTVGLTFVLGDGVDDAIMIFTGTIAAINAALEGMAFTAQPGYVGQATLQVTVDDQGNSGSGGHLLGAGVVNILVGATPRPPDTSEVPAPPEPDVPEDELPPLDIPEPEESQPDAEDLNEGTPKQPMPQVPTETPAVPAAATVAGVLRPQGARSTVTPARGPVSTAGTPKEMKSDDSGTRPVDGNTRREQAAGPEERAPDHTGIRATSADIAGSVHANRAMWSQVESMKGQMDRSAMRQQQQKAIAVGVATGMSVSFAAGYVIWLLRGGSLLASLLAATPLWKSFDPLPVLAFWEKHRKQRRRPGEKGRSNGDDERELDELFGFSAGVTPEGSWRVTE
jgi:VCBS repeat-containing protein